VPRVVAIASGRTLLLSGDATDAAGSHVPTTDLLDIYRVRMSRAESRDAVLGGDRIVPALEAHRQPVATLVAVERDGEVCALFLDESVTRLVVCVVGRDHRTLP
jgi:hypothetical protein